MDQQNGSVKKKTKKTKLVAPDGGWGWMVMVGYGLGSLFMIPIIQNFGLIYKDRLRDLEFSSTDITTLISIHSWFGMIFGIFNAPLLKKYGYRKMSTVGVTMFTVGTFLTAFANSFVQFVIFYGMVASLGMTYTMSSFSLAMNSYFKVKRSFASSRVMTITGLGPIFMPLLISELLSRYGIMWTAILLAAINMHGFIGACLLQPVKWHMKEVEDEEAAEDEDDDEDLLGDIQSIFGSESIVLDRSRPSSRRPSLASTRQPYNRSVSYDKSFALGSNLALRNTSSQDFLSKSTTLLGSTGGLTRKDVKSLSLMDNEDYSDMLGSTLVILDKSDPSSKKKVPLLASTESLYEEKGRDVERNGDTKETQSFLENETKQDEEKKAKPRKPWWKRFGRYLVKMYDLDLLADPVYWNVTVGMSVAIIGELTFSLLTPFILNDMGLTNEEIAIFAAVIAVADLIFRFLAPYLGKLCNYGSRRMYIMSLFMLLITRLGLFLTTDFTGLMVVATALGIGKGFRTVYWVLVIPDYVPLEKLASASAFQNLSTGIFLIVTGPLLGLIVQINNRYSNMIYASNVMTAITILLWTMEFVIVACKNRKKTTKEINNQNIT